MVKRGNDVLHDALYAFVFVWKPALLQGLTTDPESDDSIESIESTSEVQTWDFEEVAEDSDWIAYIAFSRLLLRESYSPKRL